MKMRLRTSLSIGVVTAAIGSGGVWWLSSRAAAQASAPPRLAEVRTEFDLKVSMRDGAKLSTDIYRPSAPGKFGVILIRTPYDNNAENNVADAMYFAQRGFAVVVQDGRGRYDSEGEFVPLFNEAKDGYDTIEWAASQPWSNGRVGTYGASYLGITQWYSATLTPPHLTAMFPSVAFSDYYHNWIYTGGALLLAYDLRWAIQMATRTRQAHYLWFDPPNDMMSLYRHLPLSTSDEAAGRQIPFWKDWLRHPTYDDYWKKGSLRDKYAQIDVPVYQWEGWFDVFLPGTLDNFTGMTTKARSPLARKNQRMQIGPWIHQAAGRHVGDIDFGSDADVDRRPIATRWFDHWLNGHDTGMMEEPPIRIFVMGDNVWRNEREWPLARTAFTRYYLHSGGRANSMGGDGLLSTVEPGAEPPDRYTYDPSNPVPTLGGNTCCSEASTPVPMGPRDQRAAERRDDVLVYTTPPLEHDMEVTGPVDLTLFAASDAPDTDFTAKLVDVFPDGFAMNLTEGILRARYRDSFEKPELLTPGTTYRFSIGMIATSNVFKRGHRIRLEVSSSNFPHYDRNPNTGHAIGVDADLRVANQAVFHEAAKASFIMLPVVPRSQQGTK
jgi:hypothetical protein